MESIVISKKSLAYDVFFAFSVDRIIDGKLMQPCVGTNEFIWQVYSSTEVEDRFDFSFSRDHVAFRADPSDMIRYLSGQFKEFERAYFLSRPPVEPVLNT